MNPQRKMVYMQKILNPGQYLTHGSSSLTKENFARTMIESMSKAMSSQETAPKEKHVRKILIGTFQAESGSFFWQYLNIVRLKEDQIICWKFCHVLHKMLRDGHRSVLTSCYDMRQVLLDCGNLWRHVQEGYGQLIYKYCDLLFNRINFLVRNPRFPIDLKVTNEQLDEIGESDPNVFFDLSCEIFDSLDDILRLQELVLVSVEMKRLNSTTSAGRCHLAPLLACIQDSSLLYDYSVKILFKLHSSLPSSTLEGHRDRFLCQHRSLKSFYINASNLQFFKTLIQIPYLSERPPNFLIASELNFHVAPQVVMIENSEHDSPERNPTQSNSQLLVDLGVDSPDDNLDSISTISHEPTLSTAPSIISENLTLLDSQASSNSFAPASAPVVDDAKLEELEATIVGLKNELSLVRAEREDLLKKAIESQATVDKMTSELRNLKYQKSSAEKTIDKLQEECRRAQHDNEIIQSAMKKLVRENALLRKDPVPSLDDNQINELKSKVEELEVKLSAKNQSDLRADLMIEMNDADRIIKEATRRIEELSEKSRTLETGIKLQVNEKISAVCTNLMIMVRNLIIHSRLLQREIVDESATLNQEFYQRNSSWTEGLISAANVVAMAAKSLVDAADRAMSGQAKYSELAASAHEIAAATTQLVVASRVKANRDSEKLRTLTGVAKQVNQCTSNVVDTARVCAELIEKDTETLDISSLSLHQTKKLEMETQVKLLELEDQLSKERVKLGLLRKRHYEQEEAQPSTGSES